MPEALILGVIAAMAWGGLALTLTQAARLSSTWTTTFWTGLTSTVLTSLVASFTGPPGGDFKDWALVAVAGLAYLANMIFYLMAVRGGAVSLVTPIVGCDGAFAALLAVVAGEALGFGVALGLAAMVFALLLVTGAGASEGERAVLPERRSTRDTVVLALLTAFLFGLVFYLTGNTSGIDPLWVVAGVRLPSTTIAFFVCLRTGSLKAPPAARPWLPASGVIDAIGFTCYVEAARSSLSVAAVTASQYATIAAVGGAILFSERLRTRQWLGVVLLVSAAALIGATG